MFQGWQLGSGFGLGWLGGWVAGWLAERLGGMLGGSAENSLVRNREEELQILWFLLRQEGKELCCVVLLILGKYGI